LNGAIFFVDNLQNITSVTKANLALMIRDQFQPLGVEGMNYSACFSAKSDFFAETKALAGSAVRFYTKLYLERFGFEETIEYTTLGREKFRFDISQLSVKDLGLVHQFASPCESKIPGPSRRRETPHTLLRTPRREGPAHPQRARLVEALPTTFPRISRTDTMNQSNCKSENVRAGTRRPAGRRVPALPCTTHRADPIPFTHSPYPLPISLRATPPSHQPHSPPKNLMSIAVN
jgi:hypothetical protein